MSGPRVVLSYGGLSLLAAVCLLLWVAAPSAPPQGACMFVALDPTQSGFAIQPGSLAPEEIQARTRLLDLWRRIASAIASGALPLNESTRPVLTGFFRETQQLLNLDGLAHQAAASAASQADRIAQELLLALNGRQLSAAVARAAQPAAAARPSASVWLIAEEALRRRAPQGSAAEED
jgi:hypothetical protein